MSVANVPNWARMFDSRNNASRGCTYITQNNTSCQCICTLDSTEPHHLSKDKQWNIDALCPLEPHLDYGAIRVNILLRCESFRQSRFLRSRPKKCG